MATKTNMKTLRILSLGAGVQSSTLALMIEQGEIPMVDCAIFADTGAEPKAVYKHLEWLKKQLSYPVHIVQWRNLKEDIINASQNKYKGFFAPFYTISDEGKKGILRRQCTADYKIKPVVQKTRELMGYSKGQRVDKKKWKVETIIGISTDEMQRMKPNQLKYITNIYPLIEKNISRFHCFEWMKKNNYPKPPRSACTFCPYHSSKEWLKVKQNKEEWEEVVKMDYLIRNSNKLKSKLFLHNSCKPIDEIDFNEDDGQFAFDFLDECEGMCGN